MWCTHCKEDVAAVPRGKPRRPHCIRCAAPLDESPLGMSAPKVQEKQSAASQPRLLVEAPLKPSSTPSACDAGLAPPDDALAELPTQTGVAEATPESKPRELAPGEAAPLKLPREPSTVAERREHRRRQSLLRREAVSEAARQMVDEAPAKHAPHFPSVPKTATDGATRTRSSTERTSPRTSNSGKVHRPAPAASDSLGSPPGETELDIGWELSMWEQELRELEAQLRPLRAISLLPGNAPWEQRPGAPQSPENAADGAIADSEQVRNAARSSGAARASEFTGEGEAGSSRPDSPHPRIHPAHDDSGAARDFDSALVHPAAALGWGCIYVGTMLLACGLALVAGSFLDGREGLRNIGWPPAALGQAALLLGICLVSTPHPQALQASDARSETSRARERAPAPIAANKQAGARGDGSVAASRASGASDSEREGAKNYQRIDRAQASPSGAPWETYDWRALERALDSLGDEDSG